MNWEAISAIGELAGAAGVIATLIYLAVQIRHSSQNIESQNIHAQTQQMQHTAALQAIPEMAIAIKKAYITSEALNPEERVLLEAYLISKIAAVRDDFLHFQKGFTTREDWEHRKRSFAPFFIANFAKDLWRASAGHYEPQFSAEITRLVDTPLEDNYIQAIRDGRDKRSGEE